MALISTNPCSEIVIEDYHTCMLGLHYQVIDTFWQIDGKKYYAVDVYNKDVVDWIGVTLIKDVDFTVSRTLKGVWHLFTEEAFTLLTLKWR